MLKQVSVLDTTLRDGAQMEGISFSVDDKLRIVAKLDELGVAYIEGGWPGSNAKDAEFFERVRDLPLRYARIATFSSTRRVGVAVAKDASVAALLRAGMPVAVIVGKSSPMHVTDVLGTTPAENLAMIHDTVGYLTARGIEVIFDAEHYFDGYALDADYAVETLRAAHAAGAAALVLCDTNGGTLPSGVQRVVHDTLARLPGARLGIHAHNDTGVAVANTLAAVEAGCVQVHGTMNGYGERCGNADLCTVIPNLELKMGCKALANGDLSVLTEASLFVSEIANLIPSNQAPYVGTSAFAHKAGLHASALLRNAGSYQHIDPEQVGNRTRVLVSELAGRGNIVHKLGEMQLGITLSPAETAAVAERIKELESRGFQFEGAEGSVELIIRRAQPGYVPPFEVLDFLVLVEKRSDNDILAEATVKARVDGETMHTAAEGDGPVNALDTALRRALLPFFPVLAGTHLTDFKVRIIDPRTATGAVTRVAINASDGDTTWTTVGCSPNIIEASFQALIDSLELPLLRRASAQ
jgi:2-isopropylmalate synthase